MELNAETISINGVEYVKKDSLSQTATMQDDMKYVIVRTYSAGVFAGFIESRTGQEVVMRNARRIWYWDGAASLSQMAMEGVTKPENCKFAMTVDRVELLQAIEILDCTAKAKKCIEGVKIWKQ